MTKNVFFEAGGGSSRLALVGSLIAPCWPPPPAEQMDWPAVFLFPTHSLAGMVLSGSDCLGLWWWSNYMSRARTACLPAIQAAAEQTNIQIVIHKCYSIMQAGRSLANVVFCACG